MDTRGFRLPQDLRDQLKDRTWTTGLSASELFRQGARDFLADPDIIQVWGQDPGNGPAVLRIRIDPGDWLHLKEVARSQKLYVSQAGRIIIQHVVRITQ